MRLINFPNSRNPQVQLKSMLYGLIKLGKLLANINLKYIGVWKERSGTRLFTKPCWLLYEIWISPPTVLNCSLIKKEVYLEYTASQVSN